MGCAGFAVFSLGIDHFMSGEDPRTLMEKDRDYNKVGFGIPSLTI